MKKSPLSTPYSSRSHGARRTPYSWDLHENANDKGYPIIPSNSYQRYSVNNGSQPSGDNFIPLNVSTPVQHEKYNANRYSPASGHNNTSPHSGWYNHRNNYHSTSRSNCNYPHSAYKSFVKHLPGQRRGGFKGKYGQSYTLESYINMNSFLENPWEDLVKKLNDSKGTNENEVSKKESLSNPKLVDSDSVEKSESKLPSEINLDDSQCSKESKNEQCVNTSFQTENTELSKISRALNNSIDTETGICSDHDSLNESTCSNDKICGAMQEKDDTCSNTLPADTDQKNI